MTSKYVNFDIQTNNFYFFHKKEETLASRQTLIKIKKILKKNLVCPESGCLWTPRDALEPLNNAYQEKTKHSIWPIKFYKRWRFQKTYDEVCKILLKKEDSQLKKSNEVAASDIQCFSNDVIQEKVSPIQNELDVSDLYTLFNDVIQKNASSIQFVRRDTQITFSRLSRKHGKKIFIIKSGSKVVGKGSFNMVLRIKANHKEYALRLPYKEDEKEIVYEGLSLIKGLNVLKKVTYQDSSGKEYTGMIGRMYQGDLTSKEFQDFLLDKTQLFRTNYYAQSMKQILTAVKSMHEQEIVHHDIKPDNLLYNENEVVLTDFGLLEQKNEASQTIEFGGGSSGYLRHDECIGFVGNCHCLTTDQLFSLKKKKDLTAFALTFIRLILAIENDESINNWFSLTGSDFVFISGFCGEKRKFSRAKAKKLGTHISKLCSPTIAKVLMYCFMEETATASGALQMLEKGLSK